MKRIFSTFLAGCMALSMSVPAFANDDLWKNAESFVQVSNDILKGYGCIDELPFTVGASGLFEEEFDVKTSNCVLKDSTITITNNAPSDDYTMYVTFIPLYPWKDGKYYNSILGPGITIDQEFPPFYYYSKHLGNTDWINMPIEPAIEKDVVKIKKGESITVTLPKSLRETYHQQTYHFPDNVIWRMEVTLLYRNNPNAYTLKNSYTCSYYFRVDEAAVKEAMNLIKEDNKTTPQKPQQRPNFTDVKTNDYFYLPVQWAIENNIASGTSNTTFSPHDTCTQAQIITLLWRANGQEMVDHQYMGVSEDKYYYHAAKWAYNQGLIDYHFNFDAPCTRLDVIYYLAALEGIAWFDPKVPWEPKMSLLENFTDIPSGYGRIIAWALEEGITSGTSKTTFSPSDVCTRGQIVSFLYRAYKN